MFGTLIPRRSKHDFLVKTLPYNTGLSLTLGIIPSIKMTISKVVFLIIDRWQIIPHPIPHKILMLLLCDTSVNMYISVHFIDLVYSSKYTKV